MATYSNIGIKLITTGDESGTWGDTTNTNFSGILDEAIAGVVTYNISSDADVTLTVSDGSSSDARHAVINFTSTTLSATRTVTFAPDTLQKTWLVINSTTGGQSLTFKQGSAGATITVPNGESAWIYSDGAGATNGAITKALDSFTNTKITTGTLNATTLDLTNLEVTNVKAKDGTAALSIADSTGKVTVSSELAVDNLNLSGNAITSTNTDGNIDLTPNGTGEVNITKVDINAGAIDGTTIGANSAAAGTFTTLTATTLGGALNANNQAITNINVDSGAIDGTPIGANSAATGAFTTATITTGNITTVNATTVDATNVEVTAIKAKDGTAAATIADSTGVVTVGSSVLTTTDINGGTIDGTTIGGASAAAGTFTSLNSSSGSTLNGGVVINELGADADTRIEGDTDANLFFVDASTDRIGIGTNSPTAKVDVNGSVKATTITADYIYANNIVNVGSFTWNSGTSSPAAATSVGSRVITSIHAGMRRCVINDSGVVQYYLDPSDSTKKADGTSANIDGTDGQVMVEIPKFYTRFVKDGTYYTWSISPVPLPGYTLHPAFTKNGVEVNFRYYSAYDACVFDASTSTYISGLNWDNNVSPNGVAVDTAADKLASVSGVYPMVGLTRAEFRTIAANRGSGWRQLDYALFSAVQLLYLIEYQSFYSQNILGAGNTNGSYLSSSGNQNDSPHTIAGASNSLGNGSTNTTTGAGVNAKPGTSFMSYRGIENFYGNCWDWADGVIVNAAGAVSADQAVWHYTNNSADFSDTVSTNMTQITATAATGSNYANALAAVDNFFIATSVGGNSATYTTDYWLGSTSADRVVLVGGNAGNGAAAGTFGVGAGFDASDRGRDGGARVAF